MNPAAGSELITGASAGFSLFRRNYDTPVYAKKKYCYREFLCPRRPLL
jgi:hypothetical protein